EGRLAGGERQQRVKRGCRGGYCRPRAGGLGRGLARRAERSGGADHAGALEEGAARQLRVGAMLIVGACSGLLQCLPTRPIRSRSVVIRHGVLPWTASVVAR